MTKAIPQHKQMAMGKMTQGYANGGAVNGNRGARLMKTGIPDSPLEDAKRRNGVVGMKKGGRAK
jgi:hypothetical protein